MRKERIILLSLPHGGRIAKVSLAGLLAVVVSAPVFGQAETWGGPQRQADYNREMRTRTWSIYAQGGTSWATDVWYRNNDAKDSYSLSPAVGGGIGFNIRPWVRVGADYLWSRYRREQRFSAIGAAQMPVKAYGNYLMNYHNAKLGLDLNVLELWPRRRSLWLNVYLGTGFGYMIARGNEYGLWFSNTLTQDGQTTPLTGNAAIDNTSTATITGNVTSANRHESFNKPFIPASLHVEADVSRQFSVGLKGEIDWLLNRKDIAPKNLLFALATIRYHFVHGKAKALRRFYADQSATLNDRVNMLQQEVESERTRAGQALADRDRLRQENADLKQRLDDCENNRTVAPMEKGSHFVQFAHNSSYFDATEAERLRTFSQSVKGCNLALVAEASTPGTKGYNQTLSEQRLQRVIDFLVAEGFNRDMLRPTIAIGEDNGKPSAEGRRVTIAVEK